METLLQIFSGYAPVGTTGTCVFDVGMVAQWHGGSVVSSVPCIRRLEPHSSRHVGTLGKSFAHSCPYNVM